MILNKQSKIYYLFAVALLVCQLLGLAICEYSDLDCFGSVKTEGRSNRLVSDSKNPYNGLQYNNDVCKCSCHILIDVPDFSFPYTSQQFEENYSAKIPHPESSSLNTIFHPPLA